MLDLWYKTASCLVNIKPVEKKKVHKWRKKQDKRADMRASPVDNRLKRRRSCLPPPSLVGPFQFAIRCEETGAPGLSKPWPGELHSVNLLSVLGPPPFLYSTDKCGSGEVEPSPGRIH